MLAAPGLLGHGESYSSGRRHFLFGNTIGDNGSDPVPYVKASISWDLSKADEAILEQWVEVFSRFRVLFKPGSLHAIHKAVRSGGTMRWYQNRHRSVGKFRNSQWVFKPAWLRYKPLMPMVELMLEPTTKNVRGVQFFHRPTTLRECCRYIRIDFWKLLQKRILLPCVSYKSL